MHVNIDYVDKPKSKRRRGGQPEERRRRTTRGKWHVMTAAPQTTMRCLRNAAAKGGLGDLLRILILQPTMLLSFSPRTPLTTFSTLWMIIFRLAPSVAVLICGVMMQLSSRCSGWSAGSGSGVMTSNPAARMLPLVNAVTSASWSITCGGVRRGERN